MATTIKHTTSICEKQEVRFGKNPLQIVQEPSNQTNFRIDKIKEKKPMLAFHITTSDPAGAGYNMVRALNQYTNHTARMVNLVPNQFHHPSDIGDILDYGDEIEQLLLEADVIHLHKIKDDFEIEIASSRNRKWKIADFLNIKGKKKKIVYHVHGHPYERTNVELSGKEYAARDALVLCATPDLQKMYSKYCNAVFFPNLVPIWHPAYLPRATDKPIRDKDGKERYFVSQTVSDQSLKDVGMIEQAVTRAAKFKPVNLLSIANVPHRIALIQRRLCHITFDHMQGYYGIASLEAMSMGKPVIAALTEHCIKSIIDFFHLPGDVLPWQRPRDQKALNDCVLDLVSNIEVTLAHGKVSRKFMEDYWNDENIARRLAAIYESV